MNLIFFEVIQNNAGVGFFKKKSNALKYVAQFNTKVEVAPLKIVERHFLDEDFDDEDLGESGW